tara:strand:+ start:700 stop:1056 length:357 start_codon:yes stop_codon:yes gene_type:complete
MDKMTPEEAYKKLQEALKKGQAGLDALPDEVKKLAMGPAADSVKNAGSRSGTDESMRVLENFPKELEAFDKPRQNISDIADSHFLVKAFSDKVKTTTEDDLEQMKSMVEAEQRLRSKM